jgi:hypothetical protein
VFQATLNKFDPAYVYSAWKVGQKYTLHVDKEKSDPEMSNFLTFRKNRTNYVVWFADLMMPSRASNL